jgi:hypothetical protein
MMKIVLLLLLFLTTAHAQIGATKEQAEERHLDPDFLVFYKFSQDGHVVFEDWYSEEHYHPKPVLKQLEPAYTWRCKPEMRAALACPTRINFSHLDPSSFSLGLKCRDELVPANITDRSGKSATPLHRSFK